MILLENLWMNGSPVQHVEDGIGDMLGTILAKKDLWKLAWENTWWKLSSPLEWTTQ